MSDPIETVRGFYETHIKRYGTGLAGGAFGLGWWAWADAVIMSDSPVGFVKVRIFFVGEGTRNYNFSIQQRIRVNTTSTITQRVSHA